MPEVMRNIEIGPIIKQVFEQRNMRLNEFASELGTVRQNVYRIFKKTHVDTGLLIKVSEVLDHNFFQYYINDPSGSHQTPNQKSAVE